MSVSCISRLRVLCGLTSLALVLTGCALSGDSTARTGITLAGNGSSPLGSSPANVGLGGTVYGAQQPITQATVTLWAAGTTGSYGTGATSVATTTTDSNGSFSFNNAGVSPCTTGQYLYITSAGGNPGAGTNQYAALMAALPVPCGAGTAGTFVNVNEVTTVASVTALQQFMSIAPVGTPAWTIGAPAANVTGMANAFTQVGNLANIATGTSAPSTATNTVSGVTYTTTITPDTAKIYTLADVLAACINTNGNSTCTSLFADTTPGSSSAPTDTIQAMYYLATNAGGVGLPAHGDTQGEPYYLCNTYITATPPFQPYGVCGSTSTTYPTDWAIGVSWSTNNGTATIGTTSAYSLAIDGYGNVWTAYGVTGGSTTNSANITEFNPLGQVQFTPVANTTITSGPTTMYAGGTTGSAVTSYSPNFTATLTGGTSPSVSVLSSRVAGLAIDTNNNAWFTGYYSSVPPTSGGLQGFLTEVTPTGSSSGFLIPADSPGAIAIDGSNNIYVDDEPASGRFYTSELEFSNASHPGTYAVFDEGIDRQTGIANVVWADPLGYAWAESTKCSGTPVTIYRANTAYFETSSTSGDVTNASASCPNYGGFPDPTGGAYYAAGGLYDVAISTGTATLAAPVVTTEAAGTGTSNGGLDGGNGTFVDGLGNVWVANSAGGVSEFSFATGAFVPLSPSGTAAAPVYGFGASYLTGKNPYVVAGDSSGDIWVGSADSALHYMVGIAGPSVTPTSAMLKTSFIGERPGAQTLVSLTSALNFSTVTTTNQAQTATLTNTGSAPVKITGASISGANQSDFTVTGNTCGTTLAIGANCSITVTFASITAGTFSGALNVASNAAGSPASATLTGIADTPVPFTVTAGSGSSPSPPSITFPSMVAGSVSAGQALVVTNNGSVALSLSIAMSGTGANLFNETTNCGTSLAAGVSCDIGLTFGPKVAGSYSASLTLTDNAGSGSQTVPVSGTATPFTIAVNTSSASAWVIDNGAITFNWNSSSGNLVSWVLDGTSDQLVDTTSTSNGQPYGLYMDNTGSFGNESVPSGGTAATPTVACTIVGGTVSGATTCTTGTGSTPYFDWSLTIPDSANSGNSYTFVEHWVVFPNDPGVHTYVELVHSASDAAASVGQMQWVFRDNLSTFDNTYEVNSGLGILGVENIPRPALSDTASTDPGRAVQNAAEDLHGFSDIPGTFGRYFDTKYDYAGYEYLHQAHGTYGVASSGKTYGVWTVLPRLETLVGGPTKQDLYFTGNIDMIEAYSDHEDLPLNLNTAASVPYNRLFGPYYIHVNTPGPTYNQTGNILVTPADMYADAISAGAAFVSQYDNEAQLVAAGYVPSTARGSVSIQINGITGTQYTAWAVLSDPATNFQVSCDGLQYWADISSAGLFTFTGVAPGTYRLSVYVLGQWGEYRQDGIVVTANNTTTVPAATWVPENFGTGTPVFTIGTPDRSSHEFLHGHNTPTGKDDREYWGNWNYWSDFAANNGAVVYYATAVGSTPATNNLQLWNYDHWGSSFDPGLFAGVYNTSDDTTDGYNYAIPSYVGGLAGATGTNGVTTPIPAWQVYFATPANFSSQTYVELSIAASCAYGSYVVTLNGHQLIWHYTNYSDCMIRSGLAGYTQWFVMEFPISDLNQTVGGSNEITVSMSQQYGAEDDAWRLELTNNTSNPASTGWHDYTYISGSTTTLNNDAVPNP